MDAIVAFAKVGTRYSEFLIYGNLLCLNLNWHKRIKNILMIFYENFENLRVVRKCFIWVILKILFIKKMCEIYPWWEGRYDFLVTTQSF